MEQDQSMLSSFIPLLIVIAIGFVVAHFIRVTANKYPPFSSDGAISGVGGWLLLLIILLIYISPFVGGYNLSEGLLGIEYQSPGLTSTDSWATYKLVTWSVFIFMGCLSFYTGLSLIKTRDAFVIKLAIITVWAIGPVWQITSSVFIPVITLGGSLANSDFSHVIYPTFIAILWTAYLYKSKRVKATYGSNTQNT